MVIRTQKSAIPTNAGGGIYCQVQSTRSLTYVWDDNSVIPGEADRPTRNPALFAGDFLLQEILRFSYVWHSPDNGLRFLTYVRNDICFEKGVFGVTPSWLFFLWDNLATGILHYAYATFRMTSLYRQKEVSHMLYETRSLCVKSLEKKKSVSIFPLYEKRSYRPK